MGIRVAEELLALIAPCLSEEAGEDHCTRWNNRGMRREGGLAIGLVGGVRRPRAHRTVCLRLAQRKLTAAVLAYQ